MTLGTFQIKESLITQKQIFHAGGDFRDYLLSNSNQVTETEAQGGGMFCLRTQRKSKSEPGAEIIPQRR